MTTNDKRMPVLFIGHGNPMNAIEKNEFSDTWETLGKTLPNPKSIVCISAHWETYGTQVTATPIQRTIHDFGGFPQQLFDVEYPAPGNPALAEEIIRTVKKYTVTPATDWGLDHGCWSVLCRMYPEADIPVVQISLAVNQPASFHYEFAKELSFLRDEGILIIGSGNIVHNLRRVEWHNAGGSEWAETANETIKELVRKGDFGSLIDYPQLGKEVQQAIPTAEHYLPLLYVLALKQEGEEVSVFNDKLVLGSLGMTSIIIG